MYAHTILIVHGMRDRGEASSPYNRIRWIWKVVFYMATKASYKQAGNQGTNGFYLILFLHIPMYAYLHIHIIRY